MPTLRSLRRSRNLTILELSLQSGIPSRQIALFEMGRATLDQESIVCIAMLLGVAPDHIRPRITPYHKHSYIWRSVQSSMALLAFMLLLGINISVVFLRSNSSVASAHAAMQQIPSMSPTAPTPAVHSSRMQAPSATVLPATASPFPGAIPSMSMTSTPIVATVVEPSHSSAVSSLADELPCPVLADPERIVITQGYGIGSHAPAEIWGGIDLALDATGDGIADPDQTRELVAIATHAGRVHLSPDSWPGGNFAQIIDEASGRIIRYGHLASFAVQEGDSIGVGTPIGLVGSTGQSSGPHLHYEIWQNGRNLDPGSLIACGK